MLPAALRSSISRAGPTLSVATGTTIRTSASSNTTPGRLFSSTSCSPSRAADFTHAVIGGGVVGLAIARELATHASSPSTLLLERHASVGTETSSRNSEVIHAGLYYGRGTLKTQLCIRGKQQLYALCEAHAVPHRRTGKWIVAQTTAQREALEQLYDFRTRELGADEAAATPLRWVGSDEAKQREPAVRAETGVLESLSTGIVDSHALMVCLQGLFEDAGGAVALGSSVVGVRPLGAHADGCGGWELHVRDAATGDVATMTAETIVNAAGLGSVDVHNLIVPAERRKKMFFAKGNYFSYGASAPKVGTLVYPAPESGHGGLGTHLTLDMAGRIKFGPDVEWVDSPDDLTVNTSRFEQTVREVKKYLPGIDENQMQPDYAGIRPKLGRQGAVMQGKGFVDFYIEKEAGYQGWINLLNIESPGLTSCLAIAERVKQLLYT